MAAQSGCYEHAGAVATAAATAAAAAGAAATTAVLPTPYAKSDARTHPLQKQRMRTVTQEREGEEMHFCCCQSGNAIAAAI